MATGEKVFLRLANGELDELYWKPLYMACVVMASPGYPDHPQSGVAIEGEIQAQTASSYSCTQARSSSWGNGRLKVARSPTLWVWEVRSRKPSQIPTSNPAAFAGKASRSAKTSRPPNLIPKRCQGTFWPARVEKVAWHLWDDGGKARRMGVPGC